MNNSISNILRRSEFEQLLLQLVKQVVINDNGSLKDETVLSVYLLQKIGS